MKTDQEIQAEAIAKYGPPFRQNSWCEFCNAQGPVWQTEDPVTWDRTELCSKCMPEPPKP